MPDGARTDVSPMLMSLIGLGCFTAGAASLQWYNGRYFELLVLCGVITTVGAEIVGAIRAGTKS